MATEHRAQWKGLLKFGEVSCGVALYTAASTSERITFNTINKASGNRVNRIFIDSETEVPVPKEQQTKGFEVDNGQYIIIDPEEVAATIPENNKTLDIEAFILLWSLRFAMRFGRKRAISRTSRTKLIPISSLSFRSSLNRRPPTGRLTWSAIPFRPAY